MLSLLLLLVGVEGGSNQPKDNAGPLDTPGWSPKTIGCSRTSICPKLTLRFILPLPLPLPPLPLPSPPLLSSLLFELLLSENDDEADQRPSFIRSGSSACACANISSRLFLLKQLRNGNIGGCVIVPVAFVADGSFDGGGRDGGSTKGESKSGEELHRRYLIIFFFFFFFFILL